MLPGEHEIDVKDLQFQVVLARRRAVQLITDINNAETKNLIKTIKDIENGPLNTKLSYSPMDVQKLRNIEIPERQEVRSIGPLYIRIIENSPFQNDSMEDICGIRGVLKVLNKRPTAKGRVVDS